MYRTSIFITHGWWIIQFVKLFNDRNVNIPWFLINNKRFTYIYNTTYRKWYSVRIMCVYRWVGAAAAKLHEKSISVKAKYEMENRLQKVSVIGFIIDVRYQVKKLKLCSTSIQIIHTQEKMLFYSPKTKYNHNNNKYFSGSRAHFHILLFLTTSDQVWC